MRSPYCRPLATIARRPRYCPGTNQEEAMGDKGGKKDKKKMKEQHLLKQKQEAQAKQNTAAPPKTPSSPV